MCYNKWLLLNLDRDTSNDRANKYPIPFFLKIINKRIMSFKRLKNHL